MDVIVKLKQYKQVNENINLHGMSTKNISAGHFFYRIQEKKNFYFEFEIPMSRKLLDGL